MRIQNINRSLIMKNNVSVRMPDFSKYDMNTKTPRKMSDEEYEKAIIAQAKKDAASGSFYSAESKNLMKSYVSPFSPDRRSLIQNTFRSADGLLDLLIRGTGKETVNFAEFKDSSGNTVAEYSSTQGWFMIGTPEENARENSFHSIYGDAYNGTESGSLDIKA